MPGRGPPPSLRPGLSGSPAIRFWREAGEVGFDTVYALDFEGSRESGVVEFGIVGIGRDGIREAHTGWCAPLGQLDWRERITHGLSEERLANFPPFAVEWERFRAARAAGPFLAHAAAVEDRFLRRQWPTPGMMPDWSGAGTRVAEWGPWLDTCALFRGLAPDRESAALAPLVEAENLGEALGGQAARFCPPERARWHAALYDALACALLFLRALEARPEWTLWRWFRQSRPGSGPEAPAAQLGLF